MEKKRQYFLLHDGCYVIHGACKSAIYDLLGGNVYSIEKWLGILLEECGRMDVDGMKIEALKMRIKAIEVETSLNYLQKIGLGRFHERPVYPYKIRSYYSKNEYQLQAEEGIHLFSLTCEIFSSCKLNCLHCRKNAVPLSNCTCRKDPKLLSRSIGINHWMRIINDGVLFGCQRIRFMGGEPLLRREEIISLLEYSYKVGYKQIDLFTNATLVDEEFIDNVKTLNVTFFVPIFSYLPKMHDKISGVVGSFNKALENIKILERKSVKTRIYIFILRENVNFLEDIVKFAKRFDNNCILEPARPMLLKNNELVNDEVVKLATRREPNFNSISLENFFINQKWNPCWKFQVAVTSNGNFVPCIRARDKIVGNIKNITLQDVLLEERLKQFWVLSKDKIEICKDCEYRYVCDDCRVFPSDWVEGRAKKTPFCNYDPYNGIWAIESSFK